MTIEEAITDLKTSKRLKKIGIPQVSLFHWDQEKLIGRNVWTKNWKAYLSNNGEIPRIYEKRIISAFTLSELIEKCGDSFGSLEYKGGGIWTAIDPKKEKYGIGYCPEEAVADLLIKLRK